MIKILTEDVIAHEEELKAFEEYMLDLLYDSGYMEH